MAALQTVVKTKALVEVLKQVFGEDPTVEYHDTYTRVYYEPDRLKRVQKKLESMSVKLGEPSDVQFDFLPLITPLVIKKGFPVAAGIFSAGFMVGKLRGKR